MQLLEVDGLMGHQLLNGLNKMIIITGASKGIGRFLFSRFKELENSVIGTYNSTFTGFEDDKESYFHLDVLDVNSVERFVNEIKCKSDKIVLINCAGITYNSFAHKSDIEKWDNVIDVNVKGTFHIIRELLPLMRAQCFGRIINFSSVVTNRPTLGVSAYATSKYALIGLTKSLALENGAKSITVNAINLGYTNLGMGLIDVPKEYQELIKKQIPNNRFCEPEEVFQTVQFLIQTEYVNGAVIDINGGLI